MLSRKAARDPESCLKIPICYFFLFPQVETRHSVFVLSGFNTTMVQVEVDICQGGAPCLNTFQYHYGSSSYLLRVSFCQAYICSARTMLSRKAARDPESYLKIPVCYFFCFLRLRPGIPFLFFRDSSSYLLRVSFCLAYICSARTVLSRRAARDPESCLKIPICYFFCFLRLRPGIVFLFFRDSSSYLLRVSFCQAYICSARTMLSRKAARDPESCLKIPTGYFFCFLRLKPGIPFLFFRDSIPLWFK